MPKQTPALIHGLADLLADLEAFLTLDAIEETLRALDPAATLCESPHCPLEGLAYRRPVIAAALAAEPHLIVGVGGVSGYVLIKGGGYHRVDLPQPVRDLISRIDQNGLWDKQTAGLLLQLIADTRAREDS